MISNKLIIGVQGRCKVTLIEIFDYKRLKTKNHFLFSAYSYYQNQQYNQTQQFSKFETVESSTSLTAFSPNESYQSHENKLPVNKPNLIINDYEKIPIIPSDLAGSEANTQHSNDIGHCIKIETFEATANKPNKNSSLQSPTSDSCSSSFVSSDENDADIEKKEDQPSWLHQGRFTFNFYVQF